MGIASKMYASNSHVPRSQHCTSGLAKPGFRPFASPCVSATIACSNEGAAWYCTQEEVLRRQKRVQNMGACQEGTASCGGLHVGMQSGGGRSRSHEQPCLGRWRRQRDNIVGSGSIKLRLHASPSGWLTSLARHMSTQRMVCPYRLCNLQHFDIARLSTNKKNSKQKAAMRLSP